MVTGVTAANMTANVIGAPVVPAIKEAAAAPVKSDRRSNKPIMEKRRRARINNCLNELKTLILDSTKKDPARHSKLEKADILEKTVKYLQELQRQQAVMQQVSDPKIINKFKAGFVDCLNEINRFQGLEQPLKRRLLQHLNTSISHVKAELHQQQRQLAAQPLHTQILPSPPSSPEQADQHQHVQHNATNAAINHAASYTQIQHTPNGYFLSNGLQVIPTKLPNGSIALVSPQSLAQHAQLQQQQQQQQTHLLTPPQPQHMTIPTRTASTGSASSHSSSGYERLIASPHSASSMHYAPPSPANSYEAMDCKPSVIQHASLYALQQQHQQQQQQLQQLQQNQQPLALVVKKAIKEEDQPWRPW